MRSSPGPPLVLRCGKLETSVRLSVYFKDFVSSACLMMDFLVGLAFSSVA